MIAGPARAGEVLPLPAHAYVPGRNARPHGELLAALDVAVPVRTRDEDAAENAAWLYGIRLFNAGFYWEAHEALEPVWRNAAPNGRERHLVAGVIQLANAGLKRAMGRERAVGRLVALAGDHVRRAFAGDDTPIMGLSGAAVRLAANGIAEASREARPTLILDFG